MKKLTNQEIFDRVWERAKVPVTAQVVGKSCRYRVDLNPDNLAPENCCFVGILIPPDKYYPELDKGGKSALSDEIKALFKCNLHRLNFLHRLQVIHDNYPPHLWLNGLRAVAKKHRLKVPE